MDPAKVQAVAAWPTPTSRQHTKRFLGFANFYRKFIRNYSIIAVPLHRLTSSTKHFAWDSSADQAFEILKQHFCSAPIVTLPDSEKQFVMEVATLG